MMNREQILERVARLETDLTRADSLPHTGEPSSPELLAQGLALQAAIAARYLSVATPTTLGLVGKNTESRAKLLQTIYPGITVLQGDPEEACTADIICLGEGAAPEPLWLVQGTHVDALDGGAELARALGLPPPPSLYDLITGRAPPRMGEEITVFANRPTSQTLRFLAENPLSASDL